jgi:predicted nucleic acid-binding Zn ribbon protein
MPFYNFKCKDCGKDLEMFCTHANLEQVTTKEGSLKDHCECGGELKREYLSIGLGPDIYKNDPRSNGYWKKGKTNDQVARIISDPKGTPY